MASCDFAAHRVSAGRRGDLRDRAADRLGAEAERAVAATFYPPRGRAELGPARADLGAYAGRTGGAERRDHLRGDDRVGRRRWTQVEAIAAVPGVGQLFVGPYDLSLSLGTTVEALLDDDSRGSPLAADRRRGGRPRSDRSGPSRGSPGVAERFRAHGITCLVVATDLWHRSLTACAGAALETAAAELSTTILAVCRQFLTGRRVELRPGSPRRPE